MSSGEDQPMVPVKAQKKIVMKRSRVPDSDSSDEAILSSKRIKKKPALPDSEDDDAENVSPKLSAVKKVERVDSVSAFKAESDTDTVKEPEKKEAERDSSEDEPLLEDRKGKEFKSDGAKSEDNEETNIKKGESSDEEESCEVKASSGQESLKLNMDSEGSADRKKGPRKQLTKKRTKKGKIPSSDEDEFADEKAASDDEKGTSSDDDEPLVKTSGKSKAKNASPKKVTKNKKKSTKREESPVREEEDASEGEKASENEEVVSSDSDSDEPLIAASSRGKGKTKKLPTKELKKAKKPEKKKTQKGTKAKVAVKKSEGSSDEDGKKESEVEEDSDNEEKAMDKKKGKKPDEKSDESSSALSSDSEGEGRQEKKETAVKAEIGSGSDSSSDPGVEDATPLRKGEKEVKHKEAKEKKMEGTEESESKTKRRSKGEKTEKKDEKKDGAAFRLAKLKRVVIAAALRFNYKQLFSGVEDDKKRIKILEKALGDKGMEAPFTIERAKAFRVKRETQQELEELAKNTIIDIPNEPKRRVTRSQRGAATTVKRRGAHFESSGEEEENQKSIKETMNLFTSRPDLFSTGDSD